MSQKKVGKHIAGTTMHFNAFNKLSFHFRNPMTYASAIFSLALMMSISSIGAAMRADLGVFGLLPAWAKDRAFGKRTYNARTETVAEKPSYRSAWAKGQFCLVPMHQFFEPCWETGKAVRWSIHRNDHDPFAVAALWDQWVDKSSGEIVLSFSMLTVNADGHPVMGRFHRPTDERRSLVVMPPASWGDWLIAKPDKAAALMLPMDEKDFAAAPVEALHAKAQGLL